MPWHTSKNYYRAEQEEFEKIAWDHWVNQPYCWCCWEHYNDFEEEYYKDNYSSLAWNFREKPKECSMNCDFCYEYHNAQSMKKLVESYFTPEEILLTLQDHLKQTNCWCYERIRSHTTQRAVTRILRARRCSSVVYIPQHLEPMIMTQCVVKILDEKLGKEVKRLHALREINAKKSVLAKYGVTLDEYNKFRIERPDIYEQMNPQENPIVLPKQKFVKVKESTLQVGSF